jgi:antitoxin (DNA-binding transcriptional repressor) of toxin-antitoxin stability system
VDTVGVRELKSGLSRYLKQVRSGARFTVTERGRAIATICPVDLPADVEWAHALVVSGQARWSGGKPAGARHPAPTVTGRSVSAAVLEDRR